MKNLQKLLLPVCLLLMLLSLTACAESSEPPSPAEPDSSGDSIVINNDLGYDMEEVYISESSDGTWESNRIEEIWRSGESLELDLTANGYAPEGVALDIQLVDIEGDLYTFMALEVRAGDQVTLTWNESDLALEAIVTSGGKHTSYVGELYLTGADEDAETEDEKKTEIASQGKKPAPGGSKSDPGDYGSPYYWTDDDGDLWYWNGYEDQYIGSGDDYYVDGDQYYESNDAGWDYDDYDYDDGYYESNDAGWDYDDSYDVYYDYDDGMGDYFE